MVAPHNADQDTPAPWDLILLKPQNSAGGETDTAFQIVDERPGGILEIHHLDTHPAYWDWAAAIRTDDIALIIRTSGEEVRHWTPPPIT